jgi:3'(2'), 5'-bisphosphate nucleotidase
MLHVAKTAVRVAAGLARRAQAGVPFMTKADASPVTIADFASQAAVALILIRELHGVDAARALLSGGAARGFSMLGEEDAAALAGADAQSAALLAHVVRALAEALPPRDDFLSGAPVTAPVDAASDAAVAAVVAAADAAPVAPAEATPPAAGAGGWRGADVLAAIGAGGGPDAPRASGDGFWVLDPIDGTKGFLRGGQWAVGLAFVSGGTPVLAAIACPALGFPACARPRGGDAPARATDRVGTLLAAGAGAGATAESLWGGVAGAGATRLRADAPAGDAETVVCGSLAHGDAGDLDGVATALGADVARAPTVRIDSMAKYALVARRDADVYVRLPQPHYAEKVWDHAPGALVVREAGGVVTDCVGAPLDFTVGPTLAKNQGVVASANSDVHARAVAATRAFIERRKGGQNK